VQIHGVLDDQRLSTVSAQRARLDPVRATQFPLHITVSYAPKRSLSELPERGTPFSLTLGGVRAWAAPESGIYLSTKVHGGWLSRLRADLADQGSPDYQPHVTLLHHRVVRPEQDLVELLAEFARGWRPVTVNLASLVAVDENGVVLERISLS
jgi:2'-5' RNA ligase